MSLVSVFLTVALATVIPAATMLPASTFADPISVAQDLKIGSVRHHDAYTVKEVTFASPTGHRVFGEIVEPIHAGLHAGVLFVHWLGDAKTTNHTEFDPDAIALAHKGVTSLLVDAMWSTPSWFDHGRSTKVDFVDTVNQVIDLRRALDVLTTRPDVDSNRIAFVGHDFGSMCGAVLAGIDKRPKWYVLMAGTVTFSEWYLLGAQPADKAAYIAKMAALNPTLYMPHATAEAFLLSRARRFADAVTAPKEVRFYDAGHSLAIPGARHDRISWLESKLEAARLRVVPH